MSLMSSDRTQLDLCWQMFRIPIRVSPWFWLTAAFLGWDFQKAGFEYLLVWIGCVFVSVLIHEMGHVFAGRLFGSDGEILLYSFGGLAFGSSDVPRRWQRIIVYLAGPGIQFLLLGLVYLVLWQFGSDMALRGQRLLLAAMGMLLIINFYWPLLNLLPIWPLDGGQVSRELCQQFNRRNGLSISLGISFVVAAALALNELAIMLMKRQLMPWIGSGSLFMAIFFGLFAAQSWMEMQQLQTRRRYQEPEEERLPWEEDADAWKRR